MIFRPSRDSRDDRHLELKGALLVAGAVVGLIGMVGERPWLVWLGIIIVGAGMVLRFVTRRRPDRLDDV